MKYVYGNLQISMNSEGRATGFQFDYRGCERVTEPFGEWFRDRLLEMYPLPKEPAKLKYRRTYKDGVYFVEHETTEIEIIARCDLAEQANRIIDALNKAAK